MPDSELMPGQREEVVRVYHQMLDAWNRRDAAGMASVFALDGHAIGFDGSEMHGPQEIASTLDAIFANHPTGSYVSLVRDVRMLGPGVAMLRAHVGMVPPGRDDLAPALNALQTVVMRSETGGWRIALLQNTPAAFHGRPEAVEQLTSELRQARTSQR